MITILYCSTCDDKLKKYDEEAHFLFQEICEHFAFYGQSMEFCTSRKGKFFHVLPLVSFLERNKYVISTDSGLDFIKVKPLGINYEMDDDSTICNVCFDRWAHE